MDISIIIPSYKSEKTIDICLNSILKQKTRLKYEIIVVDSSPTNLVDKIIKKYNIIKFIKLKSKTPPGIARNIGSEKSKGELLAFIDSDVVLDENWLNLVYKYYKQNHFVFGGAIDIWKDNSSIIKKLEYFFEFSEFKPKMKKEMRWCLPSVQLIIKKNLFNKNSFNDSYTSEDVDLTVRLSKKNNLYFNPNIKIDHVFQTTFSGLFKKSYNFGFSNMIIRKKYNVSGSKLIRNKFIGFFIIPFFAIFKFLKITWRNLRYNYFSDKIIYIFSSPLMFLLIISWMLGFYKGLFKTKNFK
ncbi:MAG: glycosyltransferase [Fusobacteriaceae bacterium]|nr:glycosyltransferase [Fusobacteriaceae bacterium]